VRGSRAEAALNELCVRHGYCLGPEDREAILRERFADADSFVDAVVIAEGRSPLVMDAKLERAPLVEVVRDWLYDEHGRGATSGKPRFPG
jgi:hypothetical protein